MATILINNNLLWWFLAPDAELALCLWLFVDRKLVEKQNHMTGIGSHS